jgi:hypothetical protein
LLETSLVAGVSEVDVEAVSLLFSVLVPPPQAAINVISAMLTKYFFNVISFIGFKKWERKVINECLKCCD